MTDDLFFYDLFGLKVRSELALPGMFEGDSAAAADVEIRVGSTKASAEGPSGYSIAANGTLLRVPEVGCYLISDGREILVDPAPGVADRNLRLYLLGSAFGALLHQRGVLPLHANAIDLGGRAFAFSGHSGAGKSTMAAWFHDRDHPILADDVCVIGFDDGGSAIAYPGVPRLRLWREAMEASGRTAHEENRSFDGLDKYDVHTSVRPMQPLKLAGIYLLHKAGEEAESAGIRRLSGVEAVETLVSNTYRGGYVTMAGRTREHLAACVQVAKAVPIFEASRLWGFDRLDGQARLLEEHARSQP